MINSEHNSTTFDPIEPLKHTYVEGKKLTWNLQHSHSQTENHITAIET
jgi:hypothetical protein